MGAVVLRTEKLAKRYGALVAVRDLSLEVQQGEVFGLLGPNGAGKTTSILMMCGLLKPDAGSVLLGGRPQGTERETRVRMGVCPQDVVLWQRLTCQEHLQFMGQMYGLPAGEARQRGERVLGVLGLSEQRHRQARTLSGGMRRRLNLALAMVHDPEILFLDEAEAGLDPQSRVRVREVIRSLAREKTVVLTTHNMDEAERVADRVAIIDHGELLVIGTPAELKRRVGEGDVVEVRIRGEGPLDLEAARVALTGLSSDVQGDLANRTLQVRALNAVGQLTAILAGLSTAGMVPGEVSIRANSLEDVFLQLTGRRLRE